MLRSKAYGQTVFNSRFSLYVPGHLTTSGEYLGGTRAHIKIIFLNSASYRYQSYQVLEN